MLVSHRRGRGRPRSVMPWPRVDVGPPSWWAERGADLGGLCGHARRAVRRVRAPGVQAPLETRLPSPSLWGYRMSDFVFVSGHLHVKGKEEKMSKSLKNYITIKVTCLSCFLCAHLFADVSRRLMCIGRPPSPVPRVPGALTGFSCFWVKRLFLV